MTSGLGMILIQGLRFLSFVVIARVVVSWFVRDTSNPIVRLIYKVTDPLFAPLSRHMTFGGFDISPIVVLFGIQLLQRLVYRTFV